MRKILTREERIGRNKEHFWIVGLSDEYVILFIELVSLGNGNEAIIKPNEVFQLAVHKLSTYVILCHNHPGGNLNPSEDDIDLTDHLLHAAEIIDLDVIDHLIISEDGYYSFKEKGLLLELRKSKKYAVYFIEEKKLFKKGEAVGVEKGIEIGEERGKKEREVEIAKKMLSKGVDIKDIADFTGLPKVQMENLLKTKSKTKSG